MGTTEATLRMENVDVKEEWQGEALPRCGFQVSGSAEGAGPLASPGGVVVQRPLPS